MPHAGASLREKVLFDSKRRLSLAQFAYKYRVYYCTLRLKKYETSSAVPDQRMS